jgi:hypothetical protein
VTVHIVLIVRFACARVQRTQKNVITGRDGEPSDAVVVCVKSHIDREIIVLIVITVVCKVAYIDREICVRRVQRPQTSVTRALALPTGRQTNA